MNFLTTERSDGVGSTIQAYLLCYALAKINNLEFHFSSFGEILNFDKDGKTNKEHTEEWNNFFNLKDVSKNLNEGDTLSLVDSTHLIKNLNYNILDHFKPYLLGLRNIIKYEPKNYYFNSDKINIGIHIRQFVENQDNDRNPIRRYFDGSEHKINYYRSLLNSLKIIKNSNIHIFTTGKEKILDFLTDQNVTVHYNENSFSDMFHLIMSDILVMANSSFSYVAHLLNHGETYVDRSFYHPTYSSSKII
jgi:hypothetical protein